MALPMGLVSVSHLTNGTGCKLKVQGLWGQHRFKGNEYAPVLNWFSWSGT